jgi:hypothetical protein
MNEVGKIDEYLVIINVSCDQWKGLKIKIKNYIYI